MIDIIFQQKGLDMRKKGNIIMMPAMRSPLAKLEFNPNNKSMNLSRSEAGTIQAELSEIRGCGAFVGQVATSRGWCGSTVLRLVAAEFL